MISLASRTGNRQLQAAVNLWIIVKFRLGFHGICLVFDGKSFYAPDFDAGILSLRNMCNKNNSSDTLLRDTLCELRQTDQICRWGRTLRPKRSKPACGSCQLYFKNRQSAIQDRPNWETEIRLGSRSKRFDRIRRVWSPLRKIRLETGTVNPSGLFWSTVWLAPKTSSKVMACF